MTLKQIQNKHEKLLKTKALLQNLYAGENDRDTKELYGLACESVCAEAQRLLERDWK